MPFPAELSGGGIKAGEIAFDGQRIHTVAIHGGHATRAGDIDHNAASTGDGNGPKWLARSFVEREHQLLVVRVTSGEDAPASDRYRCVTLSQAGCLPRQRRAFLGPCLEQAGFF